MIQLAEAAKIYNLSQTMLRKIINDNKLPVSKGASKKAYVRIPALSMKKINKLRHRTRKRTVLTVGLQKGGTGKTTITINLALTAARQGFKVLIVDLDGEMCVTQFLLSGATGRNTPTLFEVFNKEELRIEEVIQKTNFDYIDCIPSKPAIRKLEKVLLKKELEDKKLIHPNDLFSEIKHLDYDLIIFDAPPAWGKLAESAYMCSDTILCPVKSDIFSLDCLHMTIEDIEESCDTFSLPVPIIKVIRNCFGAHRRSSIDADAELSRDFSTHILPVILKSSAVIEDSINKGVSIWDYPKSKAGDIQERLLDLLDLIFPLEG